MSKNIILKEFVPNSKLPAIYRDSLAEVISKIISDKELARKLGENGRMKVVESYSWEDTYPFQKVG